MRESDLIKQKCSLTHSRTWAEVARTLTLDTVSTLPDTVSGFLSTSEAGALLLKPFHSFHPQSSDTKSAFQTKTAAINVSPSTKDQYDIEQIKEDALCLSKQAQIDEVAALRIVVQEWQQRPALQLKACYSEAELASIKDAIGPGSMDADVLDGDISRLGEGSPDIFDARRRARQHLLHLDERQGLLIISKYLRQSALAKSIAVSKGNDVREGKDRTPVLEELGLSLLSQEKDLSHQQQADPYVVAGIEAIQKKLADLEAGSWWSTNTSGREEVEESWIHANLHEISLIMDLILCHVRFGSRILNSSTMLAWLRLMADSSFFAGFQAQSTAQIQLITKIQASVSLTTLTFFDVANAMSAIVAGGEDLQNNQQTADPWCYFFDVHNVTDIHAIMFTAAKGLILQASPAVFAWGVVLWTIREMGLGAKATREGQHVQRAIDQQGSPDPGRRHSGSSASSLQQSVFEDVLDQVRLIGYEDDPVTDLIQYSMDGMKVFDVIGSLALQAHAEIPLEAYITNVILQDLLVVALEALGYVPDLVAAQIALLSSPELNTDERSRDTRFSVGDVRAQFLNDRFLMGNIYEVALARFPYESLPFLELCKVLTRPPTVAVMGMSYILAQLGSVDTFTQAMDNNFSAYHTIREDENANLVSLDQSLGMLDTKHQDLLEASPSQQRSLSANVIPAHTTGQVISEERPIVIMWYHRYSVLNFIGKLLQQYQHGELELWTSFEPTVLVVDIISLLTKLLRVSLQAESTQVRKAETIENAIDILNDAGDSLEHDQDIISVVLDLAEQEIQGMRYRKNSDRSLNLCVACIDFMIAVVEVAPSRIWTAVSRSSLFAGSGSDGMLLRIIGGVEAATTDFPFLERIVSFYSTLVHDAVTHVVERAPSRSQAENSRLMASGQASAPEHLMQTSLLAFTEAMSEALQDSQNWKFNSSVQHMQIIANIMETFSRILMYAYSIDDNIRLDRKITRVVAAAAEYVTDTFNDRQDGDSSEMLDNNTNTIPLFRSLIAGLSRPAGSIERNAFEASVRQTLATLSLCLNLNRTANLNGNTYSLQRQLYDFFPILVRLAVLDESFWKPSLELMHELLKESSSDETGSLLGRLGSDSSRSLLNVLAALDQQQAPGSTTTIAIWELLTSLVGSHQQWFAVLVLAGTSPQRSMKELGPEGSELRRGSFLDTAFDRLSDIVNLPPLEASTLLRFVNTAQQNWAWTTSRLHDHPEVFTSMMNFVGRIDSTSPAQRPHLNQIAALAAELSTVYLHYIRSIRDITVMKKMIPAFNWLTTHAIGVSGYNNSLQANLRKNFAAKFPSCGLSNFKRTQMIPIHYGENFLFDITLADQLLSFDPSWKKGQDQGFEAEFRRANINMSLVQSEIALLQSFKTLCIEHACFFVKDREISKKLAQVAQNCLKANTQVYPSEQIFESLYETRFELALALTQCLVHSKVKGAEVVSLLSVTWDAIRFRNITYDAAAANNDLPCHRSLLTILLLALQFHLDKRSKVQTAPQNAFTPSANADQSAPLILDIASHVIPQSVISLTSILHEQSQSRRSAELNEDGIVEPRDFFLLLSLLQTTIKLPLLPQITSQLSSVINNSGVAESCFLLYSWSHMLTRSRNKSDPPSTPIYADLALRLLVSLSSLPAIAEELAVESVLSRLSTARVTQVLQSCSDGVSPFDKRGPQFQALYGLWSTGILPLCLNLLHSVGRTMAGEITDFMNQFPSQLNLASTVFSYKSNEFLGSAVAKEATSLALISNILYEYRTAGASAGVDAMEIAHLKGYDEHKKALAEDIEELIARPASLRARLAASNQQEEAALRDGKLEKMVIDELRDAMLCLRGGEDEGD